MKFNVAVPNQALKVTLQNKIDHKTKPLGALGMLEQIALQVALLQQTLTPKLIQPTMLIFAGDHGIAGSGVSSYPQAVTAQMVLNFLQGGAAINVFTKQNNILLSIIDSGVNYVFSPDLNLIHAKIAMGTRNFLNEPAMTQAECEQSLTLAADIVDAKIAEGSNVFGFGEMGIGNTSSASCLMSVLCQLPVTECVGRGTGLDDARLAHKAKILSEAISYHQLRGDNTLEVLATFGGFEIAMMAGAMLRAAERQCLVLIDGFIATAALLVANKLAPNILHYCIFTHCSNELGHKKMLDFLQVKPLLNIDLRLGEGTGVALAYPLVEASVNFLNHMASFESAHISQKT